MMQKLIMPLCLIGFSSFNIVHADDTYHRPSFPIAEYKALKKVGTARITGTAVAFTEMKKSKVRVATAHWIALQPFTSYSQDWYNNGFLSTKIIAPSDPRLEQYIYKTQADENGNFHFNNLPAGKYYISTKISWYTVSESENIVSQNEAVMHLAQPISVQENQTEKVLFMPKIEY